MRGVRVRVQERDRDRLRPARDHGVERGVERSRVDGDFHRAGRADAFHDLERTPPGHQRRRLLHVEVVGLVALLAPDEQHVAEPVGGQERGGPALALDDRVGRHRGGVENGVESARRDPRIREKPLEARDHRAGRVVGAACDLEETRRRVGPRQDEVGERAADVERHSPHEYRSAVAVQGTRSDCIGARQATPPAPDRLRSDCNRRSCVRNRDLRRAVDLGRSDQHFDVTMVVTMV